MGKANVFLQITGYNFSKRRFVRYNFLKIHSVLGKNGFKAENVPSENDNLIVIHRSKLE